ncbi:MAG TPA: phage integrase N-terminal SAM-like domain-containing protein [Pseudidiomarina sp.]|nr:phage integrase N-terminal SAM-like domain-containing protein [Pseudidiomarina sp.]
MSSSSFRNSIREFMLARRYSLRLIDTYLHFIKYFIVFNNKKHPMCMGQTEVRVLLNHFAIRQRDCGFNRIVEEEIGVSVANRDNKILLTAIGNVDHNFVINSFAK